MKAPGGKFGRKKEEAITALLTQRNIEEAAKAAGIGANTLLRWPTVTPVGRRSANPSRDSSREPLRPRLLC
jgi:transposase-like protein